MSSIRLFTTAALSACSLLAAVSGPPKLRLAEVESAAPTSYNLTLNLDPSKDTFTGDIVIHLTAPQPLPVLWLNANRITVEKAGATARGKAYATAQPIDGGTDFVGLQFDKPLKGNVDVEIAYTGNIRIGASAGIFRMEDNGNQYLFTQFESTDARDAFPCFDEPSYKVPWQLTVNAPAGLKVYSNTTGTPSPSGAWQFAETKPLPSYLVAFAVGPFDYVPAGTAGVNKIPVGIVVPKGHAGEAKYAAEVTATIITREEQYFGVPFPYPKSDQVAIPTTFGFGAMENAGLVTYSQNLILAKPDRDTVRRQRGYASVAAHELAHQWFGDLVTTAWWNDIWLNEAFATWMEEKTLAEWHPEWGTRVEDVGSKLGAENADSLLSARQIRQPIESKDDISNAFDAITYNKGAAVIRMFESWVGNDDFRKGVHSYLVAHAYKNGTAGDFLDSISTAANKNVTAPFQTFLNQPGIPDLSIALKCASGAPTLHMEQKRFVPLGSNPQSSVASQSWQIPVCVRYGSGAQGQSACTLMTQPVMDWKLQASSCPAWVEANDNAVGYYRWVYKDDLLASLTSDGVEQRLSPAERVDLIGNTEALTRSAELPQADALRLVPVFHADPEREVVARALAVAIAPRAYMVPANLEPNFQHFLDQNFAGKARRLGWLPKPGEPADATLMRPELVASVATIGGDQQLADEASKLADKWLEDHSSVDPSVAGAILATAAYYGDKALWDRYLAAFKNAQDRQEKQRILQAMGRFRDPKALQAGYNAVLQGTIPFIQGAQLLFAGQQDPSTRKMPFEFMKAHFDALAKARPQGGGFDAGARFPTVGASFCDAQSRAELADFFTPRASQFTGGPRALANVLEGIDQCIAIRAAQQPSVETFLKGF